MKAQERREIIEVFEKLKTYIEEHLTEVLFLCHMEGYLGKRTDEGIYTRCGLNDRLIPLAQAYFKSQKPSKTLNKLHFNAVTYDQSSNPSNPWWRYSSLVCPSSVDFNQITVIAVNRDKIEFLKHLIQKLKK